MRCGIALQTIWLGLGLLAGCATPYVDGLSALRRGQYAEAARDFQDALARDPDRLDALLGRGIARYKEGRLDEAMADLARVVAARPASETARVYLALGHLRRGQIVEAQDQLTALIQVTPHPRLTIEADRALRLIRQPAPLTDEVRNLVAARLEAEAGMALDPADANLARGGVLLGTCCNMFGFDVVPTVPRGR